MVRFAPKSCRPWLWLGSRQSRADERTGAKALSCQSREEERTGQEAEANIGRYLSAAQIAGPFSKCLRAQSRNNHSLAYPNLPDCQVTRNFTVTLLVGLVWFHCLMAYQPLEVI